MELELGASAIGKGFDLIAFFDCLHDMGDPIGVSRHARQALKEVAHERGGVKVYKTALRCAINEDLKEERSKYFEQTQRHVTIGGPSEVIAPKCVRR